MLRDSTLTTIFRCSFCGVRYAMGTMHVCPLFGTNPGLTAVCGHGISWAFPCSFCGRKGMP